MRVINAITATNTMSPNDKMLIPVKDNIIASSSNIIPLIDQAIATIVQVTDKSIATNSNIVPVTDVPRAARHAATALLEGHVIAVPTDTIYGLAAMVQTSGAVDKLYSIKDRDCGKAISICVPSIEYIARWAKVTIAKEVLHQLLPGPFTLVFERTEQLNKNLNPGNRLVGVRVPDHHFIGTLCSIVEAPIALTSANHSGDPSTLAIQEFSSLHPKLHSVYDAGHLGGNSRLGSTVVDLSVEGKYRVLRRGCAGDALDRIMQENHIRHIL